MADDFKAGDTVEMKSGGPTMTIDSIGKQFQSSGTDGAWCSWFDEKNKRQKEWFELTSLKKVAA
jgi:uncharacterized protein YodC (DUF2158 family)